MVYYHIDSYQRYVQSLAFTNLANYPLRADAHGFTNDNSAFFPDGATNSRLQFGIGGVDDAEDADVIIHEYGHALSHAGSPNTVSGNERQGLDEGLCDYFAASYSKHLSTYRWFDVFTWDGHNTFWDGRSARITQNYNNLGTTNFYRFGELWATTLMEIQATTGREVLDRIQLQELYMNTSGMTLANAAQMMLDAEDLLYDGQFRKALARGFCARGLVTGLECELANSTDNPLLFRQDLAIYPNPASAQVVVETPAADGHLRLLNTLGQVVYSQPTNRQTLAHDLPIQQLATGTYQLVWTGTNGETRVGKLVWLPK
jgi:hypothetical protein